MSYQLTERGESVAYRVGGLLILSGYGQKPVDVSPSGPFGASPGPQSRSAINLAKELGYITEKGNLIYFTPYGVRSVSLLFAIRDASIRDELEPTEHLVSVNDFDILRHINILEHLSNDVAALVSSLASAEVPPPVSVPIPSRQNLQNLINAGLLELVE